MIVNPNKVVEKQREEVRTEIRQMYYAYRNKDGVFVYGEDARAARIADALTAHYVGGRTHVGFLNAWKGADVEIRPPRVEDPRFVLPPVEDTQ